MGVKYLSYKDLSPRRRADAGTSALNELYRLLRQPLSDDQRQLVEARIARVKGWVNGTLNSPPPDVPHGKPLPPPPPAPQNHVVVVTESLSIDESV